MWAKLLPRLITINSEGEGMFTWHIKEREAI
jgi:hypothetical protein